MLPSTTKKAAYNTCDKSNKAIRDKTVSEIAQYKDSSETEITDRINKLDHEWDVERVLETNAAFIVLLSSIMGYKNKKCCWFLMTGTVGFFLLQHALQGWCPPLPIIRELGIRTADEINNNKIALKSLRGDFSNNSKEPNELLIKAEK
ncbi:MAG: DUF2892 domain-containing protein [Petrimonas sp.]|nr:DUF2892 domain-containing protein [Petrimonas sp.]